MATMLILSMLMAVVYVAAVISKRRELPDSISALVYELPLGRWRWLWSAWLAVVTLLVAPTLTTAMADTWWASLIASATIICLAMAAALPLLPGYHNRLHNALGIAAGILSQICAAIVEPWWLTTWTAAPLAVAVMYFCTEKSKWMDGKGVLLAELICAVITYGALLMHG